MADSLGLTQDACGQPVAWGTYTPCTQCGGKCMQSCFGGSCDYVERASSNRFEGYPQTKQSCQPMYAWCKNQNPPQCFRVAPMTLGFGETSFMNPSAQLGTYMSRVAPSSGGYYYDGYNTQMPSFVGTGRKCDTFPVANNANFPSLTHYSKL